MIGVDTNVILRLFDRTDTKQTKAVERLLAGAAGREGCLVNPIVLAELVWTLDRVYRLDRRLIGEHLDRILQAPEFIVPFSDEALGALSRFHREPADFADYYLWEINRSLGCSTTVTFDRDAAESENFTLLRS